MVKRRAKITGRRIADENNAVVSVQGGAGYRRRPCDECPWRKENAGSFPAEAFRISAHTAYDAAWEMFGCHTGTIESPLTCAGFLLRNSANNLAVRLARARGTIGRVDADGADLFDDYGAMAIANGVDPDDPVLRPCRGDHDDAPR